MITLSYIALGRTMIYALALGFIAARFLFCFEKMSKGEVALLSIAGTCWLTLLLYQFTK